MGVRLAIEHLPRGQRSAARLHFVHQMDLATTALTMGRTECCVRGLLHRAKQRLRRSLGSFLG